MSRFFDPKNDVAFKRLFAREENKPLLISFLNSTLRREGDDIIQGVDILPTEMVPDIAEAKKSVLDVRCTDKKKFQYIVEMQNRDLSAYIQRAQFYVAHTYAGQISKGNEHLELKPVILLAILSGKIFPADVNAISYHHTLETETGKQYLKDMSYAFIELGKFNKSQDELKTLEDQWLYFFKQAHKAETLPPNTPQEIAKAYETVEQHKWSDTERDAYIRAQMSIWDDNSALKEAEEKGEARGEARGREDERLDIAIKMLIKGLDVSIVAEMTGLMLEQVTAMKEKKQKEFQKNKRK